MRAITIRRNTSSCHPETPPGRHPGEGRFRSLAEIVREYKDSRRNRAEQELHEFRDETSLRSCIRRAALARDLNGEKFRHQYLIPPPVLREWSRRLVRRTDEIRRCRQFAALHEILREERRAVHGIGRLTVYDTALRIGAHRGLRLEPDAVYLHAGARLGAKAMGLSGTGRTIPGHCFPQEFHSLKPHEIEHCLCIYRKHLRQLRRAGKIHLPSEANRYSGD
jgi:hypothetical protein